MGQKSDRGREDHETVRLGERETDSNHRAGIWPEEKAEIKKAPFLRSILRRVEKAERQRSESEVGGRII